MSAKRDAEALLDEVLPFAQHMLATQGEFYPYGAWMKPDRSIAQVGATDPATDQPRAVDLMETLRSEYRSQARARAIIATALVSNVRVTAPDQDRPSDAIQVSLEHVDSYCADVFLPYQIDENGQVTFGELFAHKGAGTVFADVE